MIWRSRRGRCRGRTSSTGAPSRTSARTVHAPMQPSAPVTRKRSRAHATPAVARSNRQVFTRRPMPSISTTTSSPSPSRIGGSRKTPDAGRRAGRDHVAGLEREGLRAVTDDRGDAEVHVGGAGLLQRLPVHVAGDRERLRVGDLVGRDQDRPHRAEGVERLAADPLAVAELQVAGRHVVEAGVAEDVGERVRLGDASRGPADHDPELGLVVDLARSAPGPSGSPRPAR